MPGARLALLLEAFNLRRHVITDGFGERHADEIGQQAFGTKRKLDFRSAGVIVLVARSRALGSGVRTPITAGAARLMAIGFMLRALGDFHFMGFFKRVHGTPFAYYDTWFYSPLFVCLAIICATASLH